MRSEYVFGSTGIVEYNSQESWVLHTDCSKRQGGPIVQDRDYLLSQISLLIARFLDINSYRQERWVPCMLVTASRKLGRSTTACCSMQALNGQVRGSFLTPGKYLSTYVHRKSSPKPGCTATAGSFAPPDVLTNSNGTFCGPREAKMFSRFTGTGVVSVVGAVSVGTLCTGAAASE